MRQHRWFVRRDNADWVRSFCLSRGSRNRILRLITTALLQGIRQAGLDRLAWTPELRQWRARVAFLRRIEGQESRWPDLSDEALLRTLDDWLGSLSHRS